MKKTTLNSLRVPLSLCLLASALALSTGCSSIMGKKESDEDIARSGPTVLYARTEPGTIELNRDLAPLQPARVIADVKDFKNQVTDVKLQFNNVPLEIPMTNVGGTTWQAEISPRQLEMLAVSGRTMSYEAQVIAKNNKGQVAMSRDPVEVEIKTPEVGSTG